MKLDLSPDELRSIVQHIDLPLDTTRDESAGISPTMRSAFTKLADAHNEARKAERAVIIATFKTPEGEITARCTRLPDGVAAMAFMTDTHVHGDWTLIRDADGGSIEWRHGGMIVAPPTDDELSKNKKNALRNATRAMLAWVLP